MISRKTVIIVLVILPLGLAYRPEFVGTVKNVTVQEGREAVLSCTVDKLRTYKVAWVRVDTQTILTIHTTVITRNPRVTLEHNGHTNWHLHISDVNEQDRGAYMCQINTDPMISQAGFLQVVVPPKINDLGSSTDMIVREMQDISLRCRASGFPPPRVQWRREDGAAIQRGNGRDSAAMLVEGEQLNITRVSRLHMGAYLCIARNGILPAVSKRVDVKVHFGPVMLVSSQLESAYVGQRSKRLQCETEAYPRSINYWTNGAGEMIVASEKYQLKTVEKSLYQLSMILIIHHIQRGDFQNYRCVAKNSLGEVDGVISLDEEPAPTTYSTVKLNQNIYTSPAESPAETAAEREEVVPARPDPRSDRQWDGVRRGPTPARPERPPPGLGKPGEASAGDRYSVERTSSRATVTQDAQWLLVAIVAAAVEAYWGLR
ncbi:neurotrimin-like [Amphibalanus amphitrite]|uniref:neurotrimin-like n=1 Tax=Amphibalanus amphitrite TaxID=1232801 RepID=UPI001C91CB11|nr:neurotrimin-like [Amphibalanus amphitrite]XP_043194305.1 neurotrimin-like [Amphibalanus amphitrite]